MTDYQDLAAVLGYAAGRRRSLTPFALASEIEQGLPVKMLEHVTGSVAPQDASFKYRIVPKASLARRKQDERLTGQQSERLARLAKAWSLAVSVWGDEQEARDFLFRRHPMLEDEKPVDVILKGELAGSLVEDILGRLQHGSAA